MKINENNLFSIKYKQQDQILMPKYYGFFIIKSKICNFNVKFTKKDDVIRITTPFLAIEFEDKGEIPEECVNQMKEKDFTNSMINKIYNTIKNEDKTKLGYILSRRGGLKKSW